MNPYGQVAGVSSEDQNAAATVTDTGADSGTTAVPAGNDGSLSNFTLSQAFGLLNILVGLMLVAALLLFFGGFIAYLTRLGLESRIQGLRIMYYGVSILFVLIIILGIVHYLQFRPDIVFGIIAALVLIFGGYAAVQAFQQSGEEEDHH